MPFVTLGSLTNFCDVLMAGGTGSANHSEVGSSYIHFNFTPHQDKATPSLLGDVPRGILLDQPPIFVGGQGGIVGPCRIAFGTVVAAGIVIRKDITQPNMLLLAAAGNQRVTLRPYCSALYGAVDRILANNLAYLGNLLALRAWYRYARTPFLNRTPWGEACLAGAIQRLQDNVEERIKRLGQLAAKLAQSVRCAVMEGQNTALPPFLLQERFAGSWSTLRTALFACAGEEHPPPAEVAAILRRMAADTRRPFVEVVQALAPGDRPALSAWLDEVVARVVRLFPL